MYHYFKGYSHAMFGDSKFPLQSKRDSRKMRLPSDLPVDMVTPHEIDGLWVQCQISSIYPDPVTSTSKAASVLNILGSSQLSLWDCENQLMDLFKYQSFEVIPNF
jgi:hypothetical protein